MRERPPTPEQPVVVDTTPIIALSMIGQLDLLHLLFGAVVVPEAVRQELQAGGEDAPGATALTAEWIHTATLDDPLRAELLSDLDRGEAEVIALALERKAHLVVIDERLARRHAKRLGLAITGTLGVLLLAKQQNLIPHLEPLLRRLQARGIRLGKSIVEQTLALAGEAR